jgi:phosphoribosylamine--glycine ligase
MKFLVIGSGGREHALAWKLTEDPGVERVYAAPGNGGTALQRRCRNVPLPGNPADPKVQEFLIDFVKKEGIDMTVVGPEAPLAQGIVDRFRQAGLAIVGPGAEGARLEASKAYAKDFMERYGVRSAKSKTLQNYKDALSLARSHFATPGSGPLVIKADGLAAGKGVVIAKTLGEAEGTLSAFMMGNTLGNAGNTVVLEDFLPGKEVSILAAVSANPGEEGTIVPFVSARDHKRRFEGAHGPNTGGMGAIAPVEDFSEAAMADFRTAILEPTLRGIGEEGFDYRGFIFFGLMVHEERCFLLEYNVRLGDPETQAVLPLMESGFPELCAAIDQGKLSQFPLRWKSGVQCAPVAVADGYPGPYRKGDPIAVDPSFFGGPAKDEGPRLFIAGANLDADALSCAMGKGATEGGVLRTSGGRVLSVSAWGGDLNQARERAYAALEGVKFEGMGYRRDIGVEA